MKKHNSSNLACYYIIGAYIIQYKEAIKNIKGHGRITEENIDPMLREVRLALLEADVSLPVVKDFIADVKEKALGVEVNQALNPGQEFVKIVYEDKYLVIVEKQPGILSMPAGHKSLNVKAVLDDYFHRSKQSCHAHVVHRLDRDTSGLMIYAKDMQTEQLLEHSWKEYVYDRRYVAVLSGVMEEQEGTVANWLKDNQAYFTFSSPVDNGGKYAVTHFYVLDRTQYHSLVEFKLDTGRKNQIRVHASDLGHPVCGDGKYGNGDDPCGRLALHAFLLCLKHPVTKECMEFESQIPSSFKSVFKR